MNPAASEESCVASEGSALLAVIHDFIGVVVIIYDGFVDSLSDQGDIFFLAKYLFPKDAFT